MASRSSGRYLWGKTLMDKIIVKQHIDFDFQASAPSASAGRLYVDDAGAIKFCVDGTSFSTVTVS